MPKIALVTGAVLAALSLSLAAQQPTSPPNQSRPQTGAPAQDQPSARPQPTFRLGVNFVEVDAVVRDASGRFVRDLTAEDFEVLENDAPQSVSVFSLVDIPIEPPDGPINRPAVLSDVLTNEPGSSGRVYFLVLDDLHVAAGRTHQVREMATRFVDRYLGANDLAAVIHVGRATANQAFTMSKPLLRRSISRFMGRKLPSRTLNKLADAMQQQELCDAACQASGEPSSMMGPLIDADGPLRVEYANMMLGAIEDLSAYVSRMQGRRKAVVLFSEGIDYDLESPLTDSFSGLAVGTEVPAIHGSLRAMLETATRANVTVYPVDPRGLGHELAGIAGIGLIPSDYTWPEGVEPMPSYGIRDVERGLKKELDGSVDALRTLAHETGGFAAVNSNDFERPFQRIVDANSAYYLLGYYPTDRAANGSLRKVRVRVRRPGLEVTARQGYFAPRPGAATVTPVSSVDAIREVAASPASSSGLSMRVVPQVLKAPSGMARVHLTVELGADEVPFQEANGLFRNTVFLLWEAVDADGEVRASQTQRADIRLSARNHAVAREFGLSTIAEFDLPAGRYQLRVATFEELSGRSGSVVGNLDVPRFQTSTLELSSLVLAVPRTRFGFAAVDGHGALERLLPAPPTAERVFDRDQQLALYAEVYDNDRRPHTVDLSVRVTAEDGRQIWSQEESRDSRELVGRSSEYLTALPLDQFRPGRYALTVAARSRLGTEVKRETMIVIK